MQRTRFQDTSTNRGVQIDGERLRMRRTELRLSQEKLGKLSGVDQSIIAKLEKGRLKGQKRDQQDALAEALGITVQDLCGVTSKGQAPLQTSAGVPTTWVDGGVVDDALGQAWSPASHRIVDLLVVRAMMLEVAESEAQVQQARVLLDAAARVRARGKAPSAPLIAMEVARSDVAASPSASTEATPRKRRTA